MTREAAVATFVGAKLMVVRLAERKLTVVRARYRGAGADRRRSVSPCLASSPRDRNDSIQDERNVYDLYVPAKRQQKATVVNDIVHS